VASFVSSLRYLLADVIGEDDSAPPFLPQGLPDMATTLVSDAIHLLVDYQSASYAQLYVDRLRRFIGRQDIDADTFCGIARLMAMRMSYEDPIRIAQLKLAELDSGVVRAPSTDVKTFRLDELIDSLPAAVAERALEALNMAGTSRFRSLFRPQAAGAFAGSSSKRGSSDGGSFPRALSRNGSGSSAGCI